MTGAEPLVGVALGLGLGAGHALEPDHLAAVSVLSADGPSARRGVLVGALWGAGHSLSLLACGLGVALAAGQMPARLTDTFEIGVAAMLVVLGGRAVWRALRDGRSLPARRHDHGPEPHLQPGPRRATPVVRHVRVVRPLVVGAAHGLAGSGALIALVTARLPDLEARLVFVLLFGVGSVLGMSALSGLAGWPLARLARSPAANRALYTITGTASALIGGVCALFAVQHLFR